MRVQQWPVIQTASRVLYAQRRVTNCFAGSWSSCSRHWYQSRVFWARVTRLLPVLDRAGRFFAEQRSGSWLWKPRLSAATCPPSHFAVHGAQLAQRCPRLALPRGRRRSATTTSPPSVTPTGELAPPLRCRVGVSCGAALHASRHVPYFCTFPYLHALPSTPSSDPLLLFSQLQVPDSWRIVTVSPVTTTNVPARALSTVPN